jgi:hypothetical protein
MLYVVLQSSSNLKLLRLLTSWGVEGGRKESPERAVAVAVRGRVKGKDGDDGRDGQPAFPWWLDISKLPLLCDAMSCPSVITINHPLRRMM